MVVIVFGLPGSGKSFFATRLADRMGAAYLNSDRLRLEILRRRSYSGDEKLFVYQEMLRTMELEAASGRHVVVDATFFQHEVRELYRSACRNAGIQLCFIEVEAPVDIIQRRLSRKRAYSEADFGVYLKIRKMFEPMKAPHLVLESKENNIDEMLQRAVSYLEEQAHGL